MISLQRINTAVDWHAGFRAAMNVELDEVWSKLEVWSEYLLGSRPMRVDLLIKKDRDMVIRKILVGFSAPIIFWNIKHRMST